MAVTDDTDDMYHPNNEIGFRDASNLNYIETVSSPIPNRRVSICGQVGSEIIVTSNSRQMCARQGNDVQRWELDCFFGNGIPLIGSETHLLVATNDSILFYAVNLEMRRGNNTAELLLLHQSISAPHGSPKIAWGPDKSHFIACFSNQIGVYKFD